MKNKSVDNNLGLLTVKVVVSGVIATSGKIIVADSKEMKKEIPAVIFSKKQADRILSLSE